MMIDVSHHVFSVSRSGIYRFCDFFEGNGKQDKLIITPNIDIYISSS